MATTNPTRATDRDDRTARVHHLAAQNLSNRAIGRRLGMHHTTVGRILRTTRAPERTTPEHPERTTPAPATTPERTTPPTSGAAPAPPLLLPLDPDLIHDLNVLRDPPTAALPPSRPPLAPQARQLPPAPHARRRAPHRPRGSLPRPAAVRSRARARARSRAGCTVTVPGSTVEPSPACPETDTRPTPPPPTAPGAFACPRATGRPPARVSHQTHPTRGGTTP